MRLFGIKDVFRLTGIIIIAACAVFVCSLFLNFNIDMRELESAIAPQSKPLYEAMVMTGKVVSIVSGGCLLITAAVMLLFYVKRLIDIRRRELGVMKALGFSRMSIARGFAIFGAAVFVGAGAGYAGAFCFMPLFYRTQNADGLLPDITVSFHISLPIMLVALPTAAFALMSVLYAYIKLKAPVLSLLKGRTAERVRTVSSRGDLPFLKDMRRSVVRGRKSLVFFIGFAAFCYSAMVQMSFGVRELASDVMSAMTLLIGLVLAFVTLFIAVTTVVSSNAKSVSIMRAFGYSRRECSSAVLNGYIPAAAVGFAVGTVYQYALLRIAVDVMFRDVENVPDFGFDYAALGIAAASFALVYFAVTKWSSRQLGKSTVKEIMLESE